MRRATHNPGLYLRAVLFVHVGRLENSDALDVGWQANAAGWAGAVECEWLTQREKSITGRKQQQPEATQTHRLVLPSSNSRAARPRKVT